MNDWKQRLQVEITAGRKPSCELMEEALIGALEERAELLKMAKEMSAWLGRLSVAYKLGNADALSSVMAEFIHERVVEVASPATAKH